MKQRGFRGAGARACGAAAFVTPLALALLLGSGAARAQGTSAAHASDGELGVDATPRGAVTRFYDRARRGDFQGAADFLRAPGRRLDDAPLRARQLYSVLARHVVLDPDALSDRPEGRLDDGLSPGLEELARVPSPQGGTAPVRLTRLSTGSWVLARESVDRIDDWYEQLGNRWLRERLPPWLLRPVALGLAWWQWLALPVLLVVLTLTARLAGAVLGRVARWLTRRTRTEHDDALLAALRVPRDLTVFGGLTLAVLPSLELSARAERSLERGATALAYIALVWTLVRGVDVLAAMARESAYVKARPVTEGFLPLGAKLAKVTLLLFAGAMVLQWFGLPVASLIASLGVGGVAVALAAKSTLENLLGALALSADRAFRPGDVVRIDELFGVVEHIGLRSTRVRTLDRTVVAVPNGRLAELRIESVSSRDRIRSASLLVLPHETSAATARAVLANVEAALRAHELVFQDELYVHLREVSPAGLVVELGVWFRTQDFKAFCLARQQALLAVLEAVEAAGARLVAPAQWTVHQTAPRL